MGGCEVSDSHLLRLQNNIHGIRLACSGEGKCSGFIDCSNHATCLNIQRDQQNDCPVVDVLFSSNNREAKVAWAISLSLKYKYIHRNFILLIYKSTLKPTRMSMGNSYRVWEGERQEGQINITSLLPNYRGPSEFRRKQCYHKSGWLLRLSLLKQARFPTMNLKC